MSSGFERAFETVVDKMISRFINFGWRIYGAFFESSLRKYNGIQSHVDEEGRMFLVDRATGCSMPEFDQRIKKAPH